MVLLWVEFVSFEFVVVVFDQISIVNREKKQQR